MGNHRGLFSDRFQSYYIMEFYRHIRNTQKLDIVERADGRVSTGFWYNGWRCKSFVFCDDVGFCGSEKRATHFAQKRMKMMSCPCNRESTGSSHHSPSLVTGSTGKIGYSAKPVSATTSTSHHLSPITAWYNKND